MEKSVFISYSHQDRQICQQIAGYLEGEDGVRVWYDKGLIPGEEYFEEGEKSPLDEIREYCEPLGVEVYPISAATGEGVKELLYHCSSVLEEMPSDLITYEQEYDPEVELAEETEPYTVTYDAKTKEYLEEQYRALKKEY